MNFDSIIEPTANNIQEVKELDKFSWFIKLLDDDDNRKTRVAIARKDGMLENNPWQLERFPGMKSFEMFIVLMEWGSELLKKLKT